MLLIMCVKVVVVFWELRRWLEVSLGFDDDDGSGGGWNLWFDF